ncbi:MAG: hypothetical protein AB8H03_17865 [Saprospiraceae bacterium]
MVSISKEESNFHFKVEGLHKLWALKSQLTIPIQNVVRAYQNREELSGWWKGIRMPGTHVPGLITAGTFYQSGEKIFWDVVNKDEAIIIDLEDESYKKLIIQVENPSEAIDFINDALEFV